MAQNDPKPNESQEIEHESTPYIFTVVQSTNFLQFRSTIRVFEIFHILAFSMTPHVKILNVPQNLKTWPIAKKGTSLHSPLVRNFLKGRVGLDESC